MKTIIKFGKLLDRVRYQGQWSENSFRKLAEKCEISKSEASRFYKALLKMGASCS